MILRDDSPQVRNDFLDMRVPVWIKDLGFLSDAPHKIAVATEYHQVNRCYGSKKSSLKT